MTDHFDKWINGMEEQQYEDWLDEDATPAQEEKALNIRTPISEQEESDLEGEQEYVPENEQKEPSGVVEVYDNRDLPPKKIIREITLDGATGAPIQIRPYQLKVRQVKMPLSPQIQPQLKVTPEKTTLVRPAIQAPLRQVSIPKQPSRIRTFISRINIFNRFRRNKK